MPPGAGADRKRACFATLNTGKGGQVVPATRCFAQGKTKSFHNISVHRYA